MCSKESNKAEEELFSNEKWKELVEQIAKCLWNNVKCMYSMDIIHHKRKRKKNNLYKIRMQTVWRIGRDYGKSEKMWTSGENESNRMKKKKK